MLQMSINVFENVFDICRSNFEARIICMQALNHHPQKSILNHQEHDANIKSSNKVFYVTFHLSLANHNRFERDISHEQRLNVEKGYETFTIMPTLEECGDTFSQLVTSQGLKTIDLRLENSKIDHVQIAEEFCSKAKIQLRFNFIFSLDCKYTFMIVNQLFMY